MRDHTVATIALGILLAAVGGCINPDATLFSNTFRNTVQGDVVPLAPGEPSQFVMVRLINDTADSIEFVVTAERQILITDDEGNPVIQSSRETVRLPTFPNQRTNEIGALFDCPVTRIGLGEDIDRPATEPGMFVQPGLGNTTTPGFGVPSNLLPLDSRAGNFGCGDTLILRAISRPSAVGNIQVQGFVLPWTEQPQEFIGPHTFNNARLFLEEQIPEG